MFRVDLETRRQIQGNLEVITTTLVHELELEGEEVGQNPRWLHGLSHWLGDFTMFNTLFTGLYIVQGNILTEGKLRRELVMTEGKRRSRNQKFCFIFTEMF